MKDGKPVIFISSTSDLIERQELAASLSALCAPYLYEHDRPRRVSPMNHCYFMIKHSDIFMCLVGANFGSTVPEDPEQRSIVQWEFDTAMGSPRLDVWTYVKNLPGPATVDARQKNFIQKITAFKGGVWCRFYTTSAELTTQAKETLFRWHSEILEKMRRVNRRRRTLLYKVLPAVCLGCVTVLLVAAVAGLLAGAFTTHSLLAVCSVVIALLLVCVVVLGLSKGETHE